MKQCKERSSLPKKVNFSILTMIYRSRKEILAPSVFPIIYIYYILKRLIRESSRYFRFRQILLYRATRKKKTPSACKLNLCGVEKFKMNAVILCLRQPYIIAI